MRPLLVAAALLLGAAPAVGAQARDSAAAPAPAIPRLAPDSLRAWLAARPDAVVLDVRTPAEFAQGHLTGAINLDVQAPDFAERAAALTRGVPYALYCRSGARSERAGRVMRGLGFASLVNGGGFDDLVKAGFPAAKP